MALLDKISESVKDAGKVAGDKISEQLETTKLKADISDAKKAIDGEYLAIGEYICQKAEAGEDFGDDVRKHVDNIKEYRQNIAETKEKIAKLGE